MADDITVIVGGESAGKAAKNAKSKAGKAQEADKKVKGVSKKEESLEKKLDRIEKSLTKGMKDILKALNGDKKDESKKLKGAASEILGNMSSAVGLDEDDSEESEKEDAFEKATKLTKLKPQDINIVDKQWILGSLLINSTLTDILDFLKKNISAKASKNQTENSDGGNTKISGDIKLGDFMVALEDFMYVAPRILVNSSKQLKKVSWTALIIAANVLPFFYNKTSEMFEDIYKNGDKYKDIAKSTKNIEKSYINLALAGLIATLGIPFYLTGALGALAAIPFVAATKLLYKFVPKPADSLKATVSSLLMLPFFAAMWVNVRLAASLAKIPIKEVLLGMANIGIVAASGAIVFAILGIPIVAALITLGSAAALAMSLGIFAFTLIVPRVAELGAYNYKDVLTGMLNMGIVAASGAIIFSILGIAGPLITLGTINALLLTAGIAVVYLAMKMAIKAGKISEEAIDALGFLDKGVLNGDDPAGKNNSRGLFGFLSKFGSFKIIKLLLLSILPAGLLALVGVLLTVGGFLINSGLAQFAKIGNDYFPDDKFEKSAPVRGILGLCAFVDIIENGIGEDHKGKIGLSTVLSLVPMLLFGVVLKLASDQIKKGLDAFASIKIDKAALTEVAENVRDGISSIRDAIMTTDPADKKHEGALPWLVGFVLGDEAKAAVSLLLGILPLLALGLYGKAMSGVTPALRDGINDFLTFADKGAELEKLVAPGGPFTAIGKIIDKMTGVLTENKSGFFENPDKVLKPAQALKLVAETFSILVPTVLSLSKVNADEVTKGVNNTSELLLQLFGKPDTSGWFESNNSKPGKFTTAIKALQESNISINSKSLEQMKDLLEKFTPMAQLVIDMGKLDKTSLNRGVDSMVKLIEAVGKMTGSSLADSDDGKIDKLLSVWQNTSGANQIEKSPLFKILDILSDKNFANSGFEQNVKIMSDGLGSLSNAVINFQSADMSQLKNFAEVIGSAAIDSGVNQIGRLAEMDPKLKLIANDLQSIANSLKEISANSDGLSKLGSTFENSMPQSNNVSQVTTQQDVETQSAAWQKAMQNYMMNMYEIMAAWQVNGMKVYMDTPNSSEAPIPNVDMASAQDMF